ncbi:hypothetical protein ATANTOWER_031251 [Ataeniobius toweri]|uniref:Uncharacterized protein n=1 Tax=Ataeniobius toweri TaxID=208326 RepID=A0ABU7BJ83_9TELE|nr:hypothetical protein [Ataeniobius toweri]
MLHPCDQLPHSNGHWRNLLKITSVILLTAPRDFLLKAVASPTQKLTLHSPACLPSDSIHCLPSPGNPHPQVLQMLLENCVILKALKSEFYVKFITFEGGR